MDAVSVVGRPRQSKSSFPYMRCAIGRHVASVQTRLAACVSRGGGAKEIVQRRHPTVPYRVSSRSRLYAPAAQALSLKPPSDDRSHLAVASWIVPSSCLKELHPTHDGQGSSRTVYSGAGFAGKLAEDLAAAVAVCAAACGRLFMLHTSYTQLCARGCEKAM